MLWFHVKSIIETIYCRSQLDKYSLVICTKCTKKKSSTRTLRIKSPKPM